MDTSIKVVLNEDDKEENKQRKFGMQSNATIMKRLRSGITFLCTKI